VAEPGNPIAWNRYAYVYNAPANYTDSSGHFIDTLWDVVDLATDALNCLGDSDTLACYMLVPDALALALPFVPGFGDNAIKAARRVEDAGQSRRVAYLLGGGGASREAAEQIIELSRRYERVIVNDIDQEALEGVQDILAGMYKSENLRNVEFNLGPAHRLGRLENADIFVVAPDPRWLHPHYGGSLARDLDILVGQHSRAYIATELGPWEFVKRLSNYEWGLPGPAAMKYRKGTRITRDVRINSVHFDYYFEKNAPVNMIIVTR
jgi:hypothetical protein